MQRGRGLRDVVAGDEISRGKDRDALVLAQVFQVLIAGDDAVRVSFYGRDEDGVVFWVFFDDLKVQGMWSPNRIFVKSFPKSGYLRISDSVGRENRSVKHFINLVNNRLGRDKHNLAPAPCGDNPARRAGAVDQSAYQDIDIRHNNRHRSNGLALWPGFSFYLLNGLVNPCLNFLGIIVLHFLRDLIKDRKILLPLAEIVLVGRILLRRHYYGHGLVVFVSHNPFLGFVAEGLNEFAPRFACVFELENSGHYSGSLVSGLKSF